MLPHALHYNFLLSHLQKLFFASSSRAHNFSEYFFNNAPCVPSSFCRYLKTVLSLLPKSREEEKSAR